MKTNQALKALNEVRDQLHAKKMAAAEKHTHWDRKGDEKLADYWLGIYIGLARALTVVRHEIAQVQYGVASDVEPVGATDNDKWKAGWGMGAG